MKKTVSIWSKRSTLFVIFLVSLILADKASAKLNEITLCEFSDEVFAYNGEAYFCGNHIKSGGELFRTNGTTSGTSVVKDIDIGPGSSSPTGFFEFKGFMFFFAETTRTGAALWRSDGTSSGTKLIKTLDFNFRGYYDQIIEGDEELFIHLGDVLLRTNGTNIGTYEVDVPVTGGNSIYLGPSHPYSTFTYDRGVLYFITRDTLYKLDLSSNKQTTIRDLPNKDADNQSAMILDNSLIDGSFLIRDNGLLWESDGTASGTRQIESNNQHIATFNNGSVYCDRDDGSLYLRKAGAQAAVLLYKNLEPGCNITDYGPISNSIALSVGLPGELWVTRGTANSTTKLIDVSDFDQSSVYRGPAYKSPNGYVFATGGLGVSKLWITNGTVTGTQLVKNFSLSSFDDFTVTSTGVFFTVSAKDRYQLWHTNGTSSGTRLVKDIPRYLNQGQRWAEGQRIYFLIDDEILWHSDGTAAGTHRLLYSTSEPEIDIDDANKVTLQIIMFLLDEDD